MINLNEIKNLSETEKRIMFDYSLKVDRNIVIYDIIVMFIFAIGLVIGLADSDPDNTILTKIIFASFMFIVGTVHGFLIKTDIRDYKKIKMIVKSLQ